MYPVAVTADISKMYQAVELEDEDRDFHRFVWRANKDSPVQDYRMMCVTFGVASSSYLAVQALQQTAHDFGDQFPITQSHLYTSFYVDDLLAGAEDSEAAIKLQTQPRQLLLRGGFDLRKWRSCSTQVMEQIDLELHEQEALKSLIDDHSSHQKALGDGLGCKV